MSNIQSLRPFSKGHDPRRNTKGRPKGAISPNRQFREMLISALLEKVDGKDMDKAEYLARTIIKKAFQGNTRAVKLIFEYIDGKPPTYEEKQREIRREMYQHEGKEFTDAQLLKIAKRIIRDSKKETQGKSEEKPFNWKKDLEPWRKRMQ